MELWMLVRVEIATTSQSKKKLRNFFLFFVPVPSFVGIFDWKNKNTEVLFCGASVFCVIKLSYADFCVYCELKGGMAGGIGYLAYGIYRRVVSDKRTVGAHALVCVFQHTAGDGEFFCYRTVFIAYGMGEEPTVGVGHVKETCGLAMIHARHSVKMKTGCSGVGRFHAIYHLVTL